MTLIFLFHNEVYIIFRSLSVQERSLNLGFGSQGIAGVNLISNWTSGILVGYFCVAKRKFGKF
jgi:hypothetical protein